MRYGLRTPRLQFSLRLLLLAITAFAIGFPTWYRWPYQETKGDARASRTTTWQRQWGGGRWKHGREIARQSKLLEITHYRQGRPHGLFLQKFDDLPPAVQGQLVDGKKDGEWFHRDGRGGKQVSLWRQGKLDGLTIVESENGRIKGKWLFENGRLTHINDQPVTNRMFKLLQAGMLDDRTALKCRLPASYHFAATPLKNAVKLLCDSHGIFILVDSPRVPDPMTPITAVVPELEMASALVILTEPLGLACDYRYGCLWITTAEDAENWRDPTGVAEIKPAIDSVLHRSWNELVSVDAVNEPLAEVLSRLTQPLDIEFDTTQLQSTNKYLVNHQARGIAFHDLLGQLLYLTGCRCTLDGDTLVMLPSAQSGD